MKGIFLIAASGLFAACGGDDHTTTLKCTGGASGALASDTPLTVSAGDDLTGAAIGADPHTTIPSGELSIACADDIAPDGFVALGPAVTFGKEGTWSDRPFELTLPYKAARLPAGAGRRHVRIVASRYGGKPFFPVVENRILDDADAYASRATFRASELTTYQAVAATDAGQPEMQSFGYNAIVGISMGGNAAMSIAMRHPDKFDMFADLGGEPGPSMKYTLQMVRDYVFGGFCTAASGKLGMICPTPVRHPDQFEQPSDYDHMLYQAGDGVGLTLRRGLYMKGVRDMARAMTNPALYNPMSPYAPIGIPMSLMQTPAATRCANPTVLHDFFDKDFNPDGKKDVITYCDGGDSTTLGYGVWDPAGQHLDPSELLLAVDLNGNGQRDGGEPVVARANEPWQDVGVDGLADKDEPGYDPVANPDPNHDDYHWQKNPTGTEGNNDYDQGEPFDDVGLDGVAGTCQAGATPPSGVSGCYDFGEGDGKWTISPNILKWYEHDIAKRLASLTEAQRHHMRMWFDAGIRDFLNNSVSTNAAAAEVSGHYSLPLGMFDGYGPLQPEGGSENAFDFTLVQWQDLPQNLYVRYGNPDATPDAIMAGDGRHVGTAVQVVHRATSAFAWMDKQWPDGDRTDTLASGQILSDLSFTSPHTNRVNPYGLFLPPGYDDPANAGVTYPVIYFLHGYGQQPMDLVQLSSVFANYMAADNDPSYRFQKFIIVYVDGRCRPQSDTLPVDPTGDACEGGTFYLDAPLGGPAQMETNMLDLIDYIDAHYRTKKAGAAMVTP